MLNLYKKMRWQSHHSLPQCLLFILPYRVKGADGRVNIAPYYNFANIKCTLSTTTQKEKAVTPFRITALYNMVTRVHMSTGYLDLLRIIHWS